MNNQDTRYNNQTITNNQIPITNLDKRILDMLQQNIPFVKEPWRDLAERLGIEEGLLLERIKHLKAKGLIRRIAATFDPEKAGFVSTLIAAKVSPQRVDNVAASLNKFDEITHNYKRDSEYNLWCAAVAPDKSRIENIMRALKEDKDVDSAIELPATRLFKIKVEFSLSLRGSEASVAATFRLRKDSRRPDKVGAATVSVFIF